MGWHHNCRSATEWLHGMQGRLRSGTPLLGRPIFWHPVKLLVLLLAELKRRTPPVSAIRHPGGGTGVAVSHRSMAICLKVCASVDARLSSRQRLCFMLAVSETRSQLGTLQRGVLHRGACILWNLPCSVDMILLRASARRMRR